MSSRSSSRRPAGRPLRIPLFIALVGASVPLFAQEPGSALPASGSHTALDSLVRRAVEVSPRLRAARARVQAAEARVDPESTRPDPMIMAGVQNLPVSGSFGEAMTMKMFGISQTIPARGKLAAARRIAERELDAERAQAESDSLEIVRDVKAAYYDIVYIDRSLAIVEQTRDVLVTLIGAAETRLQVGSAAQVDVLRARVEAARLGQQASALLEERRVASARLNAALDQPGEEPLRVAWMPAAVARIAVAETPSEIAFVSVTLGSRVAGSPLPPLHVLRELAMRHSPALRLQQALVAAQQSRAALARLQPRPDLNVSLQYGQRQGFSDMVTAVVSLPLPLQRARKHDPLAVAEERGASALEAELARRRNEIAAEVARLHAQLERARTQLAITVKAILPQSQAALESAISAYQAGRTDFNTVLESQATLFNSETGYHQGLAEFGRTLAELELVVGVEVVR